MSECHEQHIPCIHYAIWLSIPSLQFFYLHRDHMICVMGARLNNTINHTGVPGGGHQRSARTPFSESWDVEAYFCLNTVGSRRNNSSPSVMRCLLSECHEQHIPCIHFAIWLLIPSLQSFCLHHDRMICLMGARPNNVIYHISVPGGSHQRFARPSIKAGKV